MSTTELLEKPIDGLPEIETFDRIRVIKDEHGFIPTSYHEVTEALSLLAFPLKRGGAALHLNEVNRHQIKLKEDYQRQAEEISWQLMMPTDPLKDIDPQATVRSLAHSYADYYADAATGFNHIVDLAQAVHEEAFPKRSIVREFPAHPALKYVARHLALLEYGYHGKQHIYGFDPFKASLEKNKAANGQVAIEDFTDAIAAEVTIGYARTLLPKVASEQFWRFDFWEQRNYEARANNIARPIAETALRTYGDMLER